MEGVSVQLIRLLLLALIGPCSSVVFKEASVGERISIDCPGNDGDHRFQFWLSPTGVIGPAMNISRSKYKYDVLTGTLSINDIQKKDHGTYTCYSKNINKSTFHVEQLELIVKGDWETEYETDHTLNVYRVVIIISSLIIVVCVVLFLYHLSTKPLRNSREILEDERFLPEAMEMTAHLDTEFPREFTSSSG